MAILMEASTLMMPRPLTWILWTKLSQGTLQWPPTTILLIVLINLCRLSALATASINSSDSKSISSSNSSRNNPKTDTKFSDTETVISARDISDSETILSTEESPI